MISERQDGEGRVLTDVLPVPHSSAYEHIEILDGIWQRKTEIYCWSQKKEMKLTGDINKEGHEPKLMRVSVLKEKQFMGNAWPDMSVWILNAQTRPRVESHISQ